MDFGVNPTPAAAEEKVAAADGIDDSYFQSLVSGS
jgi:hypothetical protein